MTNKQKREYLDCLTLLGQQCYLEEIQKRNEVLAKSPTVLYKYRSFDKYTFEMIEKGYAYLSPVKDLDDPFDCISDFDLSEIYNEDKDSIKNKFIDHIIKTNNNQLTSKQIVDLKISLDKCLMNGGLDSDKTAFELQKLGLDNNKSMELAMLIVNGQNLFDAYDKTKMFDKFAKVTYNPGDVIGVCCLSEIRDNKVMWSLYSKKYKGYCIEYEIPLTKEARQFLYPVFYSRTMSNNFTIKMFDTIMAQVKRNVFRRGYTIDQKIENIGAIYDLFCIKDTDWKYQQEWRIVGGAKDHFKHLTIKAIYLGFKVSISNETKMRRYAKKYNFDLYKMNPPNGKKRISYCKI